MNFISLVKVFSQLFNKKTQNPYYEILSSLLMYNNCQLYTVNC